MEFLGIGGWELVAILIIMLIFAGPKRMIQWSYVLGRYVGMARNLWAQTAQQLQKELNESGVDIEVPKEIPTRATLNTTITKFVSDVSRPVTAPLDEVKGELDSTRKAVTPGDPDAFRAARPTPARPVKGATNPKAPAANGAVNGTAAASAANSNGPTAPPAEPPTPPDATDTGYGAWSQ